MKYLVTSHKDTKEKEKIQKKGLYCYDLRGCDDGVGIATIEENVLVNRVGSIITNERIEFQENDFIDYDFFEKVNENVGTVKELLSSKNQNRSRKLDNNMYVMDLGYRNKQPVALVEKTTEYGKEYIIAFNYEITDNKIQWGYGYYYGIDIKKAQNDFKNVLSGGNLSDTFEDNTNITKINEITITIEDIEENLCDLDTEYREALAIGLTELNYISDTPLKLKYGTEKQQAELEKVWKKPLKAKQLNEIIKYIANKMKGDFQYGQFRQIASEYIDIAKAMKINEDKQKRKSIER